MGYSSFPFSCSHYSLMLYNEWSTSSPPSSSSTCSTWVVHEAVALGLSLLSLFLNSQFSLPISSIDQSSHFQKLLHNLGVHFVCLGLIFIVFHDWCLLKLPLILPNSFQSSSSHHLQLYRMLFEWLFGMTCFVLYPF